MNKIVFFDVDGTLLPANAGKIPKNTESVISLWQDGILGHATSITLEMERAEE